MNKEKDDELNISAEDMKHFERLAGELSGTRAGGVTAKVAIGDLCKKYHKIEPTLKKVLPIIRLIPKIGKTAAEAIEFLMGIADVACPID